MDILHYLDSVDKQMFLFFNGLHCPAMDFIMWQISQKLIWVPLYLFILWQIVKIRKFNVVYTLIGIILMIVISDQVSGIFKDSVMRLRPSHNEGFINLIHLVKDSHGNFYKGGNYGFVSSHAANSFAVAIFVSLFFRKRWVSISIFIWAAIVSYSRVYLGVHYPFDILGGAIIGLLSGILIYYAENYIYNRYLSKKQTNRDSSGKTSPEGMPLAKL